MISGRESEQDKDSYEFQRARVLRVCNELAPGKSVEFDENSTMIKFRIRDESLRINLTEPSGEWLPSELADKTDDQLRRFVLELGDGKLG